MRLNIRNSAGPRFEQKVAWKYFRAPIGMIGYIGFGIDAKTNNYPGVLLLPPNVHSYIALLLPLLLILL